jgi:hypothetical protein
MRTKTTSIVLSALLLLASESQAGIGAARVRPSATWDVVLFNYTITEYCHTGACMWTYSVPLSYGTHNFSQGVAYLVGWHYRSVPTAAAWKIKTLEVGVKSQSLRVSGGVTYLDMDVAFDVGPVQHDGDDVRIEIEVLAQKAGVTGVDIQSLNQVATGFDVASDVKSVSSVLPFAAGPISYFRLDTNTNSVADPVGTNLSTLELKTSISLNSSGVDSTVSCAMEGDHGVASTVGTTCEVTRAMIFADSGLMKRATVQPFLEFGMQSAVRQAPGVTFSGRIGGVGASGMGSFLFKNVVPRRSPIESMKVRELGAIIPDCGFGLLDRGESIDVSLDGRYCWQKWSGVRLASQAPGMAYVPFWYPQEGCTDQADSPAVEQGTSGPTSNDDRGWGARIDLESAAIQ